MHVRQQDMNEAVLAAQRSWGAVIGQTGSGGAEMPPGSRDVEQDQSNQSFSPIRNDSGAKDSTLFFQVAETLARAQVPQVVRDAVTPLHRIAETRWWSQRHGR